MLKNHRRRVDTRDGVLSRPPLDRLFTDIIHCVRFESLLRHHVVPFLISQDFLSRLLKLAIAMRVAKSPYLHR